MLWISEDKPNVSEYTQKYDDFTEEQFNQLVRTGSDDQQPVIVSVIDDS